MKGNFVTQKFILFEPPRPPHYSPLLPLGENVFMQKCSIWLYQAALVNIVQTMKTGTNVFSSKTRKSDKSQEFFEKKNGYLKSIDR